MRWKMPCKKQLSTPTNNLYRAIIVQIYTKVYTISISCPNLTFCNKQNPHRQSITLPMGVPCIRGVVLRRIRQLTLIRITHQVSHTFDLNILTFCLLFSFRICYSVALSVPDRLLIYSFRAVILSSVFVIGFFS